MRGDTVKDELLMVSNETQIPVVRQAEVIATQYDGSILVAGEELGAEPFRCSVLETAVGNRMRLEPGDTVLVVWDQHRRGIVIGRIGVAETNTHLGEAPDELVIEAKKNLTLKCGDGSITIREDGKILIKGKDLVSHAQRMNRIKGGSVSIN
jgi:hypothetical protein